MTKLRRTRTATLVLCGLAIGSTAAEQQPPAVDISTPDGFTLKATYRPANAPGPPVLLIHQCNTDRHAWDGFATDLSNAGFHVLAPDLCGFGDSRGSDGRVASEQWGGDLDSALIYLLSRPGVDKGPVAVVGASCGVVEASLLATRHREIVALVLMSGFVNLDGKDYISATPSLSIFGAGAEGRQSKYRPRMPCGTDMRRILRSLTVVIPLSAVTYAQGARPGGYVSAGHATDFLQRLQGAIERDDRRAVARMVHYPATVLASGWNIPVKDSTALLTIYDAVFTPELRCAIVQSGIARTDTPAAKHVVVVSPDGLVIGGGAVWAPLKDAQYKIARMMIPPAVPSPSPRQRPERVSFSVATGERTARFTGWLLRRNVETFVVSAKRGETIRASIEGFRGHDATLRVTALAAASTLGATVKDAGRTWTGAAPADADYRIQVVHLAGYCDPAQQYRLAITLR